MSLIGPALSWARAHDRGYAALRRATRTAVVMPALLAVGDKVLNAPEVAAFAAFGSFSQLLLAEFTGPLRSRLQAQACLALAGATLVCLGTLASPHIWVAVPAMAVVGFAVVFAGAVSSVLAAATTSLLLAFILPVSLAAPVSAIPGRVEGWGMASVAAFAAVGLLWPAPARDPLRAQAIVACRALAARLRQGTADAAQQAEEAVARLQSAFFATPYRPTGLSTPARAVVRLVDELGWLDAVAQYAEADGPPGAEAAEVAGVRQAGATVLERAADALQAGGVGTDALRAAVADLRRALDVLERHVTEAVPSGQGPSLALVSALDPGFRAQELSFGVTQVAANVEYAVAAEARSWAQGLLGRQPEGFTGPLTAAHQRAASYWERHSVWLHNSVRAGAALGLAVLVADATSVQHSFWVILGTLSVLRSNALNTGQTVLRALGGTLVGFAAGAALITVVGSQPAALWSLLPVAILFGGFAPAAISFAAGQAGFTLTLVVLFNIIQPTGWRVGLVRVEDIALGCAVSLVVGLLFWPRGAGAALRVALAEGYSEAAGYLSGAVNFGIGRCDRTAPDHALPSEQAGRAAAAARRLDDAFRSFLAERGPKTLPLSDVTKLVTGVAALRLASDAVLELWQRDQGRAEGERSQARHQLRARANEVVGWYQQFADSLVARAVVPLAQEPDASADTRLMAAVSHDFLGHDGHATAAAVRLVWTGDHLDAARRLEATVVNAGRALQGQSALVAEGWLPAPGRTLARLRLHGEADDGANQQDAADGPEPAAEGQADSQGHRP